LSICFDIRRYSSVRVHVCVCVWTLSGFAVGQGGVIKRSEAKETCYRGKETYLDKEGSLNVAKYLLGICY